MSAKGPIEDVDSDEEDNVKVTEPEPVVEVDTSLNNCEVITKYQEASKIAQAVLLEVAARVSSVFWFYLEMGTYFNYFQCVAGAKIVDICRFGDEQIEQRTAAIYKSKSKSGKVILKGIAFPVCLSVNECVCHCSPLESEDAVSTNVCIGVIMVVNVFPVVRKLRFKELAMSIALSTLWGGR